MKMKLADLKRRLVPGTRLILRVRRGQPERQLRIVKSTNTVGIKFTDGAELDWPKASMLREWIGGFMVVSDDGREMLRYQWEEPVEVGDDLERLFLMFVKLSADEPARLRRCDVDRVMQAAFDALALDGGAKHDHFTDWLKSRVECEYTWREIDDWIPEPVDLSEHYEVRHEG